MSLRRLVIAPDATGVVKSHLSLEGVTQQLQSFFGSGTIVRDLPEVHTFRECSCTDSDLCSSCKGAA